MTVHSWPCAMPWWPSFVCIPMIDLLPSQHVSRVFVLTIPQFEYLKRFQRALTANTGRQHDNSQTLAVLMQEHQRHLGLTGKGAPVAALVLPRPVEGQP